MKILFVKNNKNRGGVLIPFDSLLSLATPFLCRNSGEFAPPIVWSDYFFADSFLRKKGVCSVTHI